MSLDSKEAGYKPSRGEKVVLVIDDHGEVRDVLAELLAMEGYRVYTAKDGEAGFRLLAEIPRPSLILLDWHMPAMDGGEFLKRKNLAPEYAAIPVTLMSMRGASGYPGLDFLEKPFELNQLLRAVRKQCGSARPGESSVRHE